MHALVADRRYQTLLNIWNLGPRGSGVVSSKNFVAALRYALGHRIRSALLFRSLAFDEKGLPTGIEGRALSLIEVRYKLLSAAALIQ